MSERHHPSLPEGHYLTLDDGLTMHYHDVGEGPAVVFLHGSGPGASGYSNFKGNFPYFAEHGLRALVPDLLGYGYSSQPADQSYDLDWQVDGIAAFCRALGLTKVSLVGNSLGGALAIRFALRFPEQVTNLVLMAPGGLETRETYMEMKGIRTMMGAIYRDGVTLEGMRRTFALQLYDSSSVSEDTVSERYAIGRHQPLSVFKTLRVPYLADSLHEITAPVLALWGVQDQFCPVSGALTIATQCPNAEVILLSRCGHWVMVEYQALFNQRCVEFLQRGRSQP